MKPDDRDLALAELQRAGVIAPAGFNDANGNPAFKLLGFPPGEEGERLKALFDRHIVGRDRLDGAQGRGRVASASFDKVTPWKS